MDTLVLASVNCSLPQPIDAATLAGCLRGTVPRARWVAHLSAFFLETPLDAIEAFAAAHHIEYTALRETYAVVCQDAGETRGDIDDWLGYLDDAPHQRPTLRR